MILRAQPAPTAEALWAALKKRRPRGLTVPEAVALGLGSEPYLRRALRLWAEAGHIDRVAPETSARDAAARFVMRIGAPKSPPLLLLDGRVEPRAGHMAATEFAAIRRKLGLSLVGIGRAIGRRGLNPTLSRAMRRLETGQSVIDADTAHKLRGLLHE